MASKPSRSSGRMLADPAGGISGGGVVKGWALCSCARILNGGSVLIKLEWLARCRFWNPFPPPVSWTISKCLRTYSLLSDPPSAPLPPLPSGATSSPGGDGSLLFFFFPLGDFLLAPEPSWKTGSRFKRDSCWPSWSADGGIQLAPGQCPSPGIAGALIQHQWYVDARRRWDLQGMWLREGST